ncbi:MAG: rRNA methyltransferase [Kiritimatiellaceae bacterium]|nr:rRNA methyltransferase [Kiritimatiellaceae bacterium]
MFTCQNGYEPLLSGELSNYGFQTLESGPGWVYAEGNAPTSTLCFAQLQFIHTTRIDAEGINAQAAGLLDAFMQQIREIQLPEGWPLIYRFTAEEKGLGQRTKALEKEFRVRLKKRMARLERTASSDLPRGSSIQQGLFVFTAGFSTLFISTSLWSGGQQRMAECPLAPSRSYLKTEEAFAVLGVEPVSGETVVDLGAAPGGWSYSAARRGASVTAIDNGPMKGGAKDNPLIRHLREDAFRFMPAHGERYDWLFCDLVEDPYHVMQLIERWLQGNYCRRFVINLKFGRADALGLLARVQDPNGRIRPRCQLLTVRHLFHDRDEFTLVGETRDS